MPSGDETETLKNSVSRHYSSAYFFEEETKRFELLQLVIGRCCEVFRVKAHRRKFNGMVSIRRSDRPYCKKSTDVL